MLSILASNITKLFLKRKCILYEVKKSFGFKNLDK